MSVSPNSGIRPSGGIRPGATTTYPVIAGNVSASGLLSYRSGSPGGGVGIPVNPKRYGERKLSGTKQTPKSGAAQLKNVGKVKGISATSGGAVPSAIQVMKGGNRGM